MPSPASAIRSSSGSTRSRRILEREARAEATRERVVDRLHAELQEYKQDLLLKVQRPIFVDLIQLHDDIGKMIEARPIGDDEPDRAAAVRGILESIQVAIEDILYRQGVEPFAAEGTAFDPRRQRAVATVPTDDPDRNKTIAARLRKGFQSGEKLIRPEIVSVYTFRPPAPRRSARMKSRPTRARGRPSHRGSSRSRAARPATSRAGRGRRRRPRAAAPPGPASAAAARPAPARAPSATPTAGGARPAGGSCVRTGAWTSASRTGLGRSRSLPWFCGSSPSSQRSGPSWPRNRPIRSSSACECAHQPREEDGQHAPESIGVQERLQLHAVPAVVDQLRMALDRLAQADRDPAGRQLVHVVRDQPIDRMPHHVDQLEPRQVPDHPLDRPGIVGSLV